MRIDSYTFGRISVDGKVYTRDLKIIVKTIIPEWWRRAGHTVSLEDVGDILAAEPGIVVFGTGDPGRMVPDHELAKRFADKGIEMIALPTTEAINVFNRLIADRKDLAAGFHLTC